MAETFKLIEGNSLRVNEGGFEFLVHLDWYRSLPLSCIVSIKVKVDGVEIDPQLISFGVNDHEYPLADLENHYEEFWFIQDGARVIVSRPGLVSTGETHEVWVETSVFAPYIPIGPDKFLTVTSNFSSVQVAA